MSDGQTAVERWQAGGFQMPWEVKQAADAALAEQQATIITVTFELDHMTERRKRAQRHADKLQARNKEDGRNDDLFLAAALERVHELTEKVYDLQEQLYEVQRALLVLP